MDLEVSPRKRACWISHTFIVCSVSAAVFVTQVPHGYRTVEALARGIARTPPEGGRRAARRYAGVELRLPLLLGLLDNQSHNHEQMDVFHLLLG